MPARRPDIREKLESISIELLEIKGELSCFLDDNDDSLGEELHAMLSDAHRKITTVLCRYDVSNERHELK